jgi:uncharacterized membrane protein
VIGFIVPAILDGISPAGVALVGSLAIMLATLTITHGLGPKTLAAALGTATALVLALGLGSLFIDLSHLTGLSSDEALYLRASVGNVHRAAVAVGQDHIAATMNTLVLAYAGASLPVLLIFGLGDTSLGDAVNAEAVASEIVATLVGSIGLVAAVPVTTGLAVLLAVRMAPRTIHEAQTGHAH